ncbi:NB-ARC domain-containing disease resistance protein [Melia azedarach]|uniref:NB-ARC domain-containing disease resistance protein n=1 Tax=Melia azedarach TaxID=155640 RepID=A0ACC1YK20_MELAZ|nr:NB-ARC domain-containing disease resistance protein [Melia azedarach]
MPQGIGKLTCLQTLNTFVVGRNTGSGLQELKSLIHLRETLHISGLENVKDVGDAKEAQLDGKKNLKVLFLEWSRRLDRTVELETEKRVLDMLRPHANLEELTIKGFGGTEFPIWLGDSSFSNLVVLEFVWIQSFMEMDPQRLFDHLKTLSFVAMDEWEDWIPYGSDQEVESFPQLRKLSLVRCSKLQGTFPERLPLLENLEIIRCEQLLVSVSGLPTLCKLMIYGCRKVTLPERLPLLEESDLRRCGQFQVSLSGLPTLFKLKIVGWRKMAGESATNFPSLDPVVDNDTSMNQDFLAGLQKLEELEIQNIDDVTYFRQSGIRLLQDISSLNRLVIARCPQLLFLGAEEEQNLQQLALPGRFQYLELTDCQGLEKLPQALLSLSSLVSFPEFPLPSQLRTITICGCHALESFPEAWMHGSNASLERWDISDCNSLTYIARVQLPPTLKMLCIKFCGNLRTLVEEVCPRQQ